MDIMDLGASGEKRRSSFVRMFPQRRKVRAEIQERKNGVVKGGFARGVTIAKQNTVVFPSH